MTDEARAQNEQKVRELCEKKDFDGAATVALRAYGPEILGFLVAIHRNEQDAGDVFAIFSESLWKGLAGFSWESSLRTWAYTIARNASFRFKKNAQRRGKGAVPLSDMASVGEVVQQVRTQTLTYLKTEQKDRFTALRESLPEDEQTLLILRVDRGLAWDELAQILLEEGADASPDAIKKESARLRKRFQLVKEKLLEMGKRAGLVPQKD